MLKTLRPLALALAGMVALAAMTPALAQSTSEPQLLSTHGDWSAWTFRENGELGCMMITKPLKEEGDYTRRGDVFMLITHRPAKKAVDVVSVEAGYKYKSGSKVTVTIDRKDHELFTHDSTPEQAWAPTDEDDKALTEAVRRGNSMIIKGSSSRGTLTKDTYSLKGSSAAYKAISKACGVK